MEDRDKLFKGMTVIEDPVLDPYFITRDNTGGFAVNEKRVGKNGEFKFKALSFPSNFCSCLHTIAVEKQNQPGKMFSSIQEYIDSWKEVVGEIKNVYKDWGVDQI